MNTREPSDSLSYLLIANTMGHSVLIETLRMAAYYVNHSTRVSMKSHSQITFFHEAQECFAFVQGTGLDILLMRYGLDYDPEALRGSFNYCVKRS